MASLGESMGFPRAGGPGTGPLLNNPPGRGKERLHADGEALRLEAPLDI